LFQRKLLIANQQLKGCIENKSIIKRNVNFLNTAYRFKSNSVFLYSFSQSKTYEKVTAPN